MALSPEEAKKLAEQLRKIEELSKKLGYNINLIDLVPIEEHADKIALLFKTLTEEFGKLNEDVEDTVVGFKNITQELQKQNVGVNDTAKGFRNLTSIAEKLQLHQKGINELTLKELGSLRESSRIEKQRLENALGILKSRQEELNAIQNRTSKENAELNKVSTSIKNINEDVLSQRSYYNDINLALEEEEKRIKNLEKGLGLTKSVAEGVKGVLGKLGLGGLGENLGIEESLNKAKDLSESLSNSGSKTESFNHKLQVTSKFFSEIGKNLKTGLADPLIIVGLLAQQFISALLKADQGAGQLAKDFNLSYDNANNLRSELTQIGNLSGDIAVNTRGLQESLTAVGKSLSSNATLNEKDLVTFTKLREQAGYTNDELVGLEKLSLSMNKPLSENVKNFLGSAKAVASQNGLIVNEKQLLQEVSKTSNSIKLSLGGSTEELAKAVVQSKQFGINLEQADKIADSLTNFESSISNELEAELLTGKNLNFERARSLALNNDIAGASAEILKQVGGTAEFSKMNRIQQEAIAKSVGMSKDELASSLMDREALAKLSEIEGKNAQDKFNNLVKQVGMEEAKKRLGDEQLATQFSQQSIQERFTNTVEKLQEIFVNIAEKVLPVLSMALEPIMFIVETISEVVGAIGKGFSWIGEKISAFLPNLGAAGKIFKGIASVAVVLAAYAAFASAAAIPVVGPILGGIAAAAVLSAGFGLLNSKKADDMVSPGYGQRTLLSPEGAIKLNDKDTVIAGTNLGGGTSQSSGGGNVDLSPLISEIQAMRGILNQILSKEGNVYLDGSKVGTSINVGTTKIQ